MNSLPAARDFRAGVFSTLAGALVLALTWRYPSGDLSDIGPGLMLQLTGGLLLLLGILMALRALFRSPVSMASAGGFTPRAFVIPAAMAMFALLLSWLGLALTAAVTTFIAGLASRDLSLKERVTAAVALAAFVTLLFGYGLRLQVPIWPEFR